MANFRRAWRVRLLHITTYYPGVLSSIYDRNPGLATANFAGQMSALFALRFGWSDVWREALRPLGYEVEEIVANADCAQKQWWLEFGKKGGRPADPADVVLEQARTFQPDIIFLDDYAFFPSTFPNRLREAAGGCRCVAGWCGAPIHDPAIFKNFDVVFSNIPHVSEDFRAQGILSWHLDHAFDGRLAEEIPLAPMSEDLLFTGSLFPGSQFHNRRLEILGALAERFPLVVHGELPPQQENWKDLLTRKLRISSRASQRAALDRCIRPSVYGRNMYERLGVARIALNIHIDEANGQASNMRLFEATGMGACVLTDGKNGMERIFDDGHELVVFDSMEDCLSRVAWLLDHPDEAYRIGRNGRARTLRDHTFGHRAVTMDRLLVQAMKGKN